MPKKTTPEEIGDMLTHVVKHMATKDDVAEIRNDMARKEQIVALHTQITSIEIPRLRYEGWKRKRHCRLQEAARKLPKPSAWSAFPPAPGEQDQQCRHRQAEHLAPPLPESKTQDDACPYDYAADYGDGAGGFAQPITPQPMNAR
jgi:hypothetical protein